MDNQELQKIVHLGCRGRRASFTMHPKNACLESWKKTVIKDGGCIAK
jgi:hypothetical protein